MAKRGIRLKWIEHSKNRLPGNVGKNKDKIKMKPILLHTRTTVALPAKQTKYCKVPDNTHPGVVYPGGSFSLHVFGRNCSFYFILKWGLLNFYWLSQSEGKLRSFITCFVEGNSARHRLSIWWGVFSFLLQREASTHVDYIKSSAYVVCGNIYHLSALKLIEGFGGRA